MATTYSGRLVTPGNFAVPSLLDLALQRGRMPRFNGATRQWWSVLHHVHALYQLLCYHAGASPLVLYAALLHDGEETMTYDTMTTWKTEEQRRLERRLEERIYDAFLAGHDWRPAVAALKQWDRLLLRAEMEVLGPPHVAAHSGLLYLPAPDGLGAAVAQVDETARLYFGAHSSTEEDAPLVRWFMLHAAPGFATNPNNETEA